MEYKQVILVRTDLKLPTGKLAAQVAHASLEAALTSDKKILTAWRLGGAKKIVLKVADEKELRSYLQRAQSHGLRAVLITDAGHTVVSPGTVTCLGIGPDDEKKIDSVTGELPML